MSRKTLLVSVIVLLGILGAVAVPTFIRARSCSCTEAAINNLRQIDGAKEQWARELAGRPVQTNRPVPVKAVVSDLSIQYSVFSTDH